MNNKIFANHNHLRDKMFRFALRILDNYEEAQDVTQDIFEKLLRKKTEVNGYRNIEAFSLKMTKDLCFDRLKHKKIKLETLKEFEGNNYIKTNYDESELVVIVKKLINKLPEKQKITIHLRDIEGCEFDEIISIMNLDINAVRMNLSRARKTIKDKIEKITNYGLQ